MLTRIQTSTRGTDEGFTLIELLVVIIIIGILAAIAVPVFLKQREKAVDTSIKSDLRTVAQEIESYFASKQSYPAEGDVSQAGPGSAVVIVDGGSAKVSAGNAFSYSVGAEGFCLLGVNAKGTGGESVGYQYQSTGGGLQTEQVSTCTIP